MTHKEEVVPKQNVAVNINQTLNLKEANLLGRVTSLSTTVPLAEVITIALNHIKTKLT